MYKRKPKWNLSLTDHFNRNARVGRLWIIYTHQNLGNKLAIKVTKRGEGEKKRFVRFYVRSVRCSSGKMRQKSDHKHWNTHPDLSYQDKPAQTATLSMLSVVGLGERTLTHPAWNYTPALLGEEEDSRKKKKKKKKRRIRMLFAGIMITMATGLDTRNNTKVAVKNLKSILSTNAWRGSSIHNVIT